MASRPRATPITGNGLPGIVGKGCGTRPVRAEVGWTAMKARHHDAQGYCPELTPPCDQSDGTRQSHVRNQTIEAIVGGASRGSGIF